MKALLEIDMPDSCRECPVRTLADDCITTGRNVMEFRHNKCRPDWCPIQPKRKRLLDIAMEQDDIDVSEIECPSEVRPEFQPYEKQCSRMSCVQCWGQEVVEGDG